MSTNANIRKKGLLDALRKSLGVITTACASIHPDDKEAAEKLRQCHYTWLRRSVKYREQVESVLDISLDFAESQLFKQIKEGNPTSTIFYLKTKGKKRGYVERKEIEEVNNPFNELMKSVAQRKKNGSEI